MAESSYPAYGPRENQFAGVESQPLAFPNISIPNLGGFGPEVSAAGSATEAFAQIAQGVAASRRAKAIAAYQARVAEYNAGLADYNATVGLQNAEYSAAVGLNFADYNANVGLKFADYNADIAEVNAEAQAQASNIEALQSGRQAAFLRQDMALAQQTQTWREARLRERQAFTVGTTRAIMGASGVMQSGSPLMVVEETIRQQEYDILAQRYEAGLHMRATGQRAEEAEYAAALSRYEGGERLRIGRQAATLTREEARIAAQGTRLTAAQDAETTLLAARQTAKATRAAGRAPGAVPADTSQAWAGLLNASGTLIGGLSRYEYLKERQKGKTLGG